jgi:dihydrofolate reductase
MRKLKLQMQTTVDGYVAGPNGELDWMSFKEDDELLEYINFLVDSSDTLLLGRKMTDGFVNYWTSILDNPESPEYAFARKMVDIPKIVFSKTVRKSNWANTSVANGDLVEEVEKLKNQAGRDIIVYGGASFVGSLIKNNLIDEYNLFVNPVALGKGMRIFDALDEKLNLKMVNAKTFSGGKVVLCYEKS